MLNRAPALSRVAAVSFAVLLAVGVATPAAAASTTSATQRAVIVSSQSNLVPAGSQVVSRAHVDSTAAVTANSRPPAGYRLYENHFKSKQTCENRGKWLRDVGHNIDNYWCTPRAQDNDRYWLYIYGFCNTDRIINGATVVAARDED